MIISSLKSVGSGRSFPDHSESENDLTFTLSPEQKDRLITDEQVRYQAFSMLWERVNQSTFGIKDFTVMSWNQILKLNCLKESTSDGVDQVRYEIY